MVEILEYKKTYGLIYFGTSTVKKIDSISGAVERWVSIMEGNVKK